MKKYILYCRRMLINIIRLPLFRIIAVLLAAFVFFALFLARDLSDLMSVFFLFCLVYGVALYLDSSKQKKKMDADTIREYVMGRKIVKYKSWQLHELSKPEMMFVSYEVRCMPPDIVMKHFLDNGYIVEKDGKFYDSTGRITVERVREIISKAGVTPAGPGLYSEKYEKNQPYSDGERPIDQEYSYTGPDTEMHVAEDDGTDYISAADGSKSALPVEKNGDSGNRYKLKLLFEYLEQMLFICWHNINADLSRNKEDEFQFEYYMDFINGRLSAMFDETFLNMDEFELVQMLKKGAKCVYDINISTIAGNSFINKYKPLSDEEKKMAFLNRFIDSCAGRDDRESCEQWFDLKKRDRFRDELERFIGSVFADPESARRRIDEHWGRRSMELFEKQCSGPVHYSKAAWRRMFGDKFNAVLLD